MKKGFFPLLFASLLYLTPKILPAQYLELRRWMDKKGIYYKFDPKTHQIQTQDQVNPESDSVIIGYYLSPCIDFETKFNLKGKDFEIKSTNLSTRKVEYMKECLNGKIIRASFSPRGITRPYFDNIRYLRGSDEKAVANKIFFLVDHSKYFKNIEELILGTIGEMSESIFMRHGFIGDIEKQISRKRGDLKKYQSDLETEVLIKAIETGKEFYDIGQIEKQYGFESAQGLWRELDEKIERIKSNLASKSKALGKERKTRKELVEILSEQKKEEISFLILNWLSQVRTFSDSQLENILCYGNYNDLSLPLWKGGVSIVCDDIFTRFIYGAASVEYTNRVQNFFREKNWQFNQYDAEQMTHMASVVLTSMEPYLDYLKRTKFGHGVGGVWELFIKIKPYKVDGKWVVSQKDQGKVEEIKQLHNNDRFNLETRARFYKLNEELKEHK